MQRRHGNFIIHFSPRPNEAQLTLAPVHHGKTHHHQLKVIAEGYLRLCGLLGRQTGMLSHRIHLSMYANGGTVPGPRVCCGIKADVQVLDVEPVEAPFKVR